MTTTLDTRNEAIRATRQAWLDTQSGPRVGDYVRFADRTRRISHIWDFEDGSPVLVQTSDSGSWYLGQHHNGAYCSFSGSLCTPVPLTTMELTSERRPGSVWFFRDDHSGAGRDLHTEITFRVYACSMAAPE